ncbi:MAG: TonB family protein [Bacteroidales bacterium]|nr:MAG: TonB family protein [Bacteroidales bacterium]
MKNYFIEHRKGLFGTIVFHVIIAIIFIIFGFRTPLPLPEEEGILINFGTDDAGFGLIEPTVSYQPEQEDASVPEVASSPESESTTTEEEILTQELEEAPEVEAVPEKDPELEKKEREAREAEERRQAELEQQRLEELERQRQEELERQRREEEQRRANDIQNRIGDALTGAKNQAQNTSTGEGVTDSIGNQGRQDGSVESTNRTGEGLGDKGISFSLEGRTPQSLPKPEYNSQAEGIVVVAVTVDRNGNVTSATPGVQGSTTLNDNLVSAAKKAALAAKFDRKPEAPATQRGTITYIFVLQ